MKQLTSIKRISALVLIFIMCLSFAGCGEESSADTLVIGNGQMNEVFSPFFSETDNDGLIVRLTSMTLLRPNQEGQLESYGAKYEEPIETVNENGEVLFTTYRFQLQEGLQFSDGEPVTADDIIFSIKVLCDPTYNGLSAVGSLPIVGLAEYKYDTEDYQEVILELQTKAEEVPQSFVEEYIMECAVEDCSSYSPEEIAAYLGIDLDPALSEEEQAEVLIQTYFEYELENSLDYYAEGAKVAYLTELEDEYFANKGEATQITEIAGVKKLDERTVEITLEGVHPSAIWDLAEIPIAPEHYYCNGLEQGSFQKGQLGPIREKDSNPLGAGPYVFKKYENNVVFLTANENYLLGRPEIPQIKVVVSTDANMVDGIIRSEIDIAEVAATRDVLMKAEDEKLGIITTDFQGYGYIGINSENIADQNIRKGLLSLMNREPAVNTYFGGLAKVIERPMDSSSWAYPDNAEPFYSYDINKALHYFKEAGYRQVTEKGKTVLEKDGVPLSIIAGVGGEGTMDHPAAIVFTQMKTDLESLGGQLEIVDCDMSVLVEGLYQGSWDLWAASWEVGMDPDMSSRYATGEESNFYRISNSRLDELLKQAVSTVEMNKRRELYQEAMEIIMDQGIELPLYQRQDLKVYNPEVIDSKSLPDEMTGYYGYLEEIHKLRLVKP